MYEVDFLSVGNKKDADAITARFTRMDTGELATLVIDAGWQDDGETVVAMIRRYGSETVDLAVVTHPDGDHIGGMGKLLDAFPVDYLAIHRIDQRGGGSLRAASAVAELVERATALGTIVVEPFAGLEAFGGSLTFLGPDATYYEELVEAQVAKQLVEAVQPSEGKVRKAFASWRDRILSHLPIEIPFDDGPGTGPRNNSSAVTLLQLDDRRALLTADAGVPALERALDFADEAGLEAVLPDLVQISHHGSKRNSSSALLNRMLGPIGSDVRGKSVVSVVSKEDPKHPSGRVVNAFQRRGYKGNWTVGGSLCWSSPDAPSRPDYSLGEQIPPLEELDDDA